MFFSNLYNFTFSYLCFSFIFFFFFNDTATTEIYTLSLHDALPIPGLESAEMSTTVVSTSGVPIVVERTMRWDATGYGSHTEKAANGAETTWYFAEGSQGFFHTFLLLANPGSVENHATVRYLVEGGNTVMKSYTLAPTSRLTIDAGAIPELVNRSFGMTVTFPQPAVAERAMYFGSTPLFSGGH